MLYFNYYKLCGIAWYTVGIRMKCTFGVMHKDVEENEREREQERVKKPFPK